MPVNPVRRRAAALALFLLLPSCARYLPIRWRESPGRAESVEAVGKRLARALAQGVREKAGESRGGEGARRPRGPLKVVVAAFPEARTGFRTVFSERIERALRRALQASSAFEVVDAGGAIAWQEVSVSFDTLETGWLGLEALWRGEMIGRPEEDAEVVRMKGRGAAPGRIREALSRALDDDHPIKGLWPNAVKGGYGENSAVFAASMRGADAAVFGAYALGPGRIRIWAAVVGNDPPRALYYKRGLADILGEPERIKKARPYLALARDHSPRRAVPREWLSRWIWPRPRLPLVQPAFWGESSFEVAFEQIGARGKRSPLTGGALLAADTLVTGRLGVGWPRYIYGFSMDASGRHGAVLTAPGGRAPVLVQPKEETHFTARLLPAGRSFRIYFVASPKMFDPAPILEAARRRLGISREYRGAARGAPPGAWFVAPGQEGLILEQDWDQQVFWFFRSLPR
ncbi:MAG: hypothetical protein V3V62_05925 [bacterium]